MEAELATVCAECSKEELDKLAATGRGLLSQGVTGFSVESQHAVPGSKRMKLSSSSNTINSASTSTKASQIRKQVRVFAPPLTDNEMERAKRSAIPDSTTADTRYCIKLWNDWCEHTLKSHGDVIPPLGDLTAKEMSQKLSCFIFQIQKQDGSEFPPDTLHHIVSGIQRHLRWNGKPGIDLYKDACFADFRMCLDSEMKRLQRAGLGSQKKKAEPLTEEEEELLWNKDYLGCKTPQTLVDTILFMNGVYFALRSGSEHRQLRSEPCQIQAIEVEGQRSRLK